MSKTYPSYTYSSYPDEIDQFDRFTDLTLDTIEYAKQYSNYMERGDLTSAAQILVDHPELKPSLINAANLNRIIDALKCIETFYVEDVQKYLIEIIKYSSVYSSNTKYSKYDLVTYNDIAYLCISSTTPIGTPVTNSDYFTPLTWRGEKGEPGINLSFLGIWSATTTYQKDSCVTYNNVLYASSVDDNLAKTPSSNSDVWNIVFDISQIVSYDNSSSGLSSTNLQSAIDELLTKIITNESNINTNANNINTNTNNISDINSRISNVDNTRDADKSVNYANSAGTANLATSATNANYATSAGSANSSNYAISSGNSDTVDGFHFTVSTTDLTPGSSTLASNTFYFVYE